MPGERDLIRGPWWRFGICSAALIAPWKCYWEEFCWSVQSSGSLPLLWIWKGSSQYISAWSLRAPKVPINSSDFQSEPTHWRRSGFSSPFKVRFLENLIHNEILYHIIRFIMLRYSRCLCRERWPSTTPSDECARSSSWRRRNLRFHLCDQCFR